MTAANVAGVYAQAALDYAAEGGRRDAVVESCRSLVGEGRKAGALTQELIAQLDDPRLGKDKAKQALGKALEGRLEPELGRLLMLLIDKNRLADAPAILSEIVHIADREAGRIAVIATSAQPLSDAARARMTAGLAQAVGPNIRLEERVDPALIGGMTLRIADILVDASVKRRLADLKNRILDVRLPVTLWSE